MNSVSQTEDFFNNARTELPAMFAVTAIPTLMPGVIAPGTVHNALSAGVGPVHKKINGRVVLERESFLAWLENRPKMPKNDKFPQ